MRTLALMEHSSRVKRKELLSSFNFAAFYLPQLLKAKRVLYMDSDVDGGERLRTYSDLVFESGWRLVSRTTV